MPARVAFYSETDFPLFPKSQRRGDGHREGESHDGEQHEGLLWLEQLPGHGPLVPGLQPAGHGLPVQRAARAGAVRRVLLRGLQRHGQRPDRTGWQPVRGVRVALFL